MRWVWIGAWILFKIWTWCTLCVRIWAWVRYNKWRGKAVFHEWYSTVDKHRTTMMMDDDNREGGGAKWNKDTFWRDVITRLSWKEVRGKWERHVTVRCAAKQMHKQQQKKNKRIWYQYTSWQEEKQENKRKQRKLMGGYYIIFSYGIITFYYKFIINEYQRQSVFWPRGRASGVTKWDTS